MHALRNPAPLRITTVMLKLARSRLLLLRERMMLMLVLMGMATHGNADDAGDDNGVMRTTVAAQRMMTIVIWAMWKGRR